MLDDPPRVIAQASDYEAFLNAIRQRVVDLNITHSTLDSISGMQDGYTSKLLADPPIRRIGPLVLYVVLQSLGMKLALVEDREALQAVASRLVPRKTPLRSPPGEGRKAQRHRIAREVVGAGVAAASD
jgi:hypothetical protein